MAAGSPSGSNHLTAEESGFFGQMRRLTESATSGLFAPKGLKTSSPATIAGEKRKPTAQPDDPADLPSSSSSPPETSGPYWKQVRHCAQPHILRHIITQTDTLSCSSR